MSPELILSLKDTLGMFVFLAVELTALFLIISYLVGVLQSYVPPEKIERILSSKNGKGYVIAALLGSITPFCSCSTIPFLKGLLRAKAGFGPMMVFLFSSPLLNPIVITLFVVTFGYKVAILYFSLAMGVSVIAGYVLEKLKFDRYIKPLPEAQASSCSTSACSTTEPSPNESSTSCCSTTEADSNQNDSCCDDTPAATTKPNNRWKTIWDTTWVDFKVALPYLFIGVALGSIIHGFVPTDLITEYASEDNQLAIPFAAVVGIPLYVRAITLIPLTSAFVAKGMGIGAVMAFIIGSAGASLPEVILLKSMFKNPLIIAFLIVVLGMAVIAGFTFNYLF